MKPTTILEGKTLANQIREEIKETVTMLKSQGRQPGLGVILVGEDPASQTYVKSKARACEKAGIYSRTVRLPNDITEAALLQEVAALNQDKAINGFLVQLPLPAHIDTQKVLETVSPDKDVDGAHPYNAGLLTQGLPRFQPATPAGIIELFKYYNIDTAGKHVVILGRSNIVGKPMANMLLQKAPHANAIVTVAHSAARELAPLTRQADILIAAIGQPELIKKDMIKKDAVVIDVGMNRIPAATPKGYRLAGDVAFEEVAKAASCITPVPGGVGVMTIAMLLKNTLQAFYLQENQSG